MGLTEPYVCVSDKSYLYIYTLGLACQIYIQWLIYICIYA